MDVTGAAVGGGAIPYTVNNADGAGTDYTGSVTVAALETTANIAVAIAASIDQSTDLVATVTDSTIKVSRVSFTGTSSDFTLTIGTQTSGATFGSATRIGLATTVNTGSGTGCVVEVQEIGETAAQAAEAVRQADSEWYTLIVTGLEDEAATILSLATWVESATPLSTYAFTTNLIDVPTSVTTDIFSQIKALSYTRTLGFYSTYAAQPDGVAGIIGYAMGQMRGSLRNSAFTLNFKSITGITVEALTATQFNNVVGKGGNVYINRGEFYNWFQNGTMMDGSFFDERIYLDKLANDITLNVSDLFNQVPKVPQTEGGVTQIIGAINPALDAALRTGFVAPGRWLGQNIMNLEYGDSLPNGYLVQAEAIADQAKADRDARKAPPIYVAVKLAGAIHSVVIRVDVDR